MMSCVHCYTLSELACRVSPSVMALLGDVASQSTVCDHRCLRSDIELTELSLEKLWETIVYTVHIPSAAGKTEPRMIGHLGSV